MTVEDVARQVIAAVDSDAGYLLAARWVAARYQQLCSRARFRHLRRVGQLYIRPDIHQGNVACTLGSDLITTTDATAQTALLAQQDSLLGRWIKCRTNWHEIVEYDFSGPTFKIRLSIPFAENSNPGSGYHIVQRFIQLDPTARWIADTMLLQNRSVAIDHMTFAEMDITFPRRPIVSGYGPIWWAEYGVHQETGSKIVELYPYSTNAMVVQYVFWQMPPLLQEKDIVPGHIDPYVLREGALIDAMRYKASQAAKAGQGDMAAFWTNSYRSQSTQWERQILEAIRSDLGTDDVSFIMRSNREARPRDVVSARDEIYARGQRP